MCSDAVQPVVAAAVASPAPAAAAPVKMVSPSQPQPVDNYSAPPAAPSPRKLETAIAQWDFNAETPEEARICVGLF
jgi:hypothetical protein